MSITYIEELIKLGAIYESCNKVIDVIDRNMYNMYEEFKFSDKTVNDLIENIDPFQGSTKISMYIYQYVLLNESIMNQLTSVDSCNMFRIAEHSGFEYMSVDIICKYNYNIEDYYTLKYLTFSKDGVCSAIKNKNINNINFFIGANIINKTMNFIDKLDLNYGCDKMFNLDFNRETDIFMKSFNVPVFIIDKDFVSSIEDNTIRKMFEKSLIME